MNITPILSSDGKFLLKQLLLIKLGEVALFYFYSEIATLQRQAVMLIFSICSFIWIFVVDDQLLLYLLV